MLEDCTNGDCSGDLKSVEGVEISPKAAAGALIEQRSDPEFLGLTENGEILCGICDQHPCEEGCDE